jgi:hypothetical protein
MEQHASASTIFVVILVALAAGLDRYLNNVGVCTRVVIDNFRRGCHCSWLLVLWLRVVQP